jgi:TolB-like protein
MFPPEDLAGAPGAMTPVAVAIEEALARTGLEVVSDVATEAVLARNRIRYVGGVDAEAADVVRRELGVDAVLITSLEAYDPAPPLLLSVSARLVAVTGAPRVLWIDAFSRAGTESRGLLGLGGVNQMSELQRRAASALARSLSAFLRDGRVRGARCAGEKTFAPRTVHRSSVSLDGTLRVAVLPFVNETKLENGGEIVTREFLGQLAGAARFEVIDPGVVRAALLKQRIVLREGVSLEDARRVLDALGADLVLSGEVHELAQSPRGGDAPRAEFTVLLLDGGGNVVWQSRSRNTGADGVWLFDFGAVRTAVDLVCRMAAGVVSQLREAPR